MLTYKGRQIPDTFEEIIDPKHTALIVHELLNDFCAEGGVRDKEGRRIDASEIVQPVAKLIEEARRQELRVIYVRYTMHADYSTMSDPDIWKHRESILKPDAPPPPVVDGTWGWENLDEVKPQPGDIIVRKYKVDAFFETPLDALLRWNRIRTIVIVGIGAEVGIVPTVMHAHSLGYFSVAVSDCIRPSDPARAEDAMLYIGDWSIIKDHTQVLDAWRSHKS
ncbi:MAG: cysteine hydrolase [Chloroflexi bacterium]|nr:cysteine hydrolase [Chloroflexota bacterium]